MDPCAGLHILAHGSIPLPYLPNLCAVLRPAPLASYYFPFLSFPLLSPCIGLSLDWPWLRDLIYPNILKTTFEVRISKQVPGTAISHCDTSGKRSPLIWTLQSQSLPHSFPSTTLSPKQSRLLKLQSGKISLRFACVQPIDVNNSLASLT